MKEKDLLREELLKKLLPLTFEEIERRSKDVQRNIFNLSIYRKAKIIMVYYPMRGEANLLGMIRKVLGKKEVCFPIIDLESKNLVPYKVRDLKKDFIKGPYGVTQPDIKRTEKVSPKKLDLVFVPGLAFDSHKNRLGRGIGFYDRFIKLLNRHTKKIGVAFDFQILKTLPVHIPQDEKVDIIVAETICF